MTQAEQTEDFPIQYDGPSPLWILLLHWKVICGITLVAMILAALVSGFVPKVFRASSTLMVASPRYTQNLKLPPPSIDMTTVKTLSNSYTTYQIVISRLRTQAGIINSLHDKIQSEDPWAAIAATSATEAANLLGWPLDESFREAWADLPPAYLLPAYLGFDEDFFAELDPIQLGKYLNSQIKTSKETNMTTEYQPLITLTAESSSQQAAALLVFIWSKTIQGIIQTDFIGPVFKDQVKRLSQIQNTDEALEDVHKQIRDLLVLSEIDLKEKEKEAITATLYSGSSPLFSLRETLTRDTLKNSAIIRNLRAMLNDLELNGEWIGNLNNLDEVLQDPEKKHVADGALLEANKSALLELEAVASRLTQITGFEERSSSISWNPPYSPDQIQSLVKKIGSLRQANSEIEPELLQSSNLPAGDIKTITQARDFLASLNEVTYYLQGVIGRQETFIKTTNARKALLTAEKELYTARKENNIEQISTDLKVLTQDHQVAMQSLGNLLGQPGVNENSPETLALKEKIRGIEIRMSEIEDKLATIRLLLERLEENRKHAFNFLELQRTFYESIISKLTEISQEHIRNQKELSLVNESKETLERLSNQMNAHIQNVLVRQNSLKLKQNTLQKIYDNSLEDFGGVEALSIDYSNVLRVHLFNPPEPPKNKVAPSRSVIVLIAGLLIFLLTSAGFILHERLRMLRGTGVV